MVKILVASWCVHCYELEKFLQDESVEYLKLDIEKDPEGRKLYQQLGRGGIPIMVINNNILRGFDKRAVRELLEQSRPRHPQIM